MQHEVFIKQEFPETEDVEDVQQELHDSYNQFETENNTNTDQTLNPTFIKQEKDEEGEASEHILPDLSKYWEIEITIVRDPSQKEDQPLSELKMDKQQKSKSHNKTIKETSNNRQLKNKCIQEVGKTKYEIFGKNKEKLKYKRNKNLVQSNVVIEKKDDNCNSSVMENLEDVTPNSDMDCDDVTVYSKNSNKRVRKVLKKEQKDTLSDKVPPLKRKLKKKPFSCPICRKTFVYASRLATHNRSHTGERPYVCKDCGKTFYKSFDLLRHTRTHTKEKPYSCHICEKRFVQDCNLVKHIRTHTGENPFACNVCGRSFNQSGNLTRHYRIHTGEKPYSCTMCEKSFVQNAHLEKHYKTIHKIELKLKVKHDPLI
ncbi:zinc finger protein 1-like [Leptidea sinapis]|uniref:C2H2-type domain-containing protein n=1 Tax=Leptidea sinapis TaxID=189913 RepID=A0A5E4Q6H2_9NEOP|nr:zinc finger protein 1-like [Leptidea sinapis]VVC92963.1 unnamed protein product [Leptidea sinapis]